MTFPGLQYGKVSFAFQMPEKILCLLQPWQTGSIARNGIRSSERDIRGRASPEQGANCDREQVFERSGQHRRESVSERSRAARVRSQAQHLETAQEPSKTRCLWLRVMSRCVEMNAAGPEKVKAQGLSSGLLTNCFLQQRRFNSKEKDYCCRQFGF